MKRLIIFFALCFFMANLFAQDIVRTFEITDPKYKMPISFYNAIEFLDSRGDDFPIGRMQVGLLKNTDALLKLKMPLLPQLKNLLMNLTDSASKNGTLLFQLKQFNFSEITGTRYCYLDAALYVKQDSMYKKLSVLDTVIIITTPDVTKALQREGNSIISDFVAKSILRQPADNILYSINTIQNIDSVEKRQIPVYNTTVYKDGLYNSYTSFKNQMPDMQGIIDARKDGSIYSIKITDSAGKKVKIKSKNLYAVINKGQIFIATEYGYYPAQKINDNFFFTGDVRVASSTRDVAGGQIALGLVGAALASTGNQEKFDMIIDHLTGRFVHITRIISSTELN